MNAAAATDNSEETFYQFERYLGSARRSPALSAYYRVKPLMPRSVQLGLRRLYRSRQVRRTFPAWPIEPVLVQHQHEQLRAAIHENRSAAVACVGFWPESYKSACILTHDVEGPRGIRNIDRVLEIEQRHGVVSSWNFVAEDYDIPDGVFERLREAGCEIGLHGIRHDCKLFESRREFEAQLPKIHAYMNHWDAVGFRSPATHRHPEWMHELGCLYDSSFPDTDPFEPQAGGCCSIFPFMFGQVVELPITLVQDHTLWEILRHDSIGLWLRKSAWIIRNHGLINVLTHPDYLVEPERFMMYKELLQFLSWVPDCWRALPRDVASWWQQRETIRVERHGEDVRLSTGADPRARLVFVRESEGQLHFEVQADSQT